MQRQRPHEGGGGGDGEDGEGGEAGDPLCRRQQTSGLPAVLPLAAHASTKGLGLRTGCGALGSEEPELESMAVVLQSRPHCAQGDGCAQTL